MADTKISNLTALAEAPATGDLLAIVDVSASATKKLTVANLIDAVEANANAFTAAQTITVAATPGLTITRSSAGSLSITWTTTAGSMYTGVNSTGVYVVGPNLDLSSSPALLVNATGQISITGAAVTSAALTITSTTGALLVPRMTGTQRDALTPTNGMILYNSTTGKFQGYEAGAWADLI